MMGTSGWWLKDGGFKCGWLKDEGFKCAWLKDGDFRVVVEGWAL